jgi:glutathione synthase/RimK-type ligase-like ATP-grasp enzyme
VVGEDVHATEIVSDALDYRYARRAGGTAELRAVELSSDAQEKCVALTRGLGLAFAGIDLKVTPAGEIFCFEVNPSPAFSFFEANTGQPIAASLARHLAGS